VMRVGIIGCGKIADGHAEQLRALDGVQLVAACDREPLMVGQFLDRWPGLTGYGDVAAMLQAERLDVVHVATPPDSHVALACAALDAGCHVFVEKPFALDARGAREILDRAELRGRKACVNYLYNFESPALALQGLVEGGRLGDVVHIETSYGYNLSGDYGIAVMGDPAHWVHRLPGKLFHNVIDHVLAKVVPFLQGPVGVQAAPALPGAHVEHQVAQVAYKDPIGVPDGITDRIGALVDDGDKGALGLPAEGPESPAIDEVEDQLQVGRGRRRLLLVAVPGQQAGEALGEPPPERGRLTRLAGNRDREALRCH